eukprot:7209308-Prymnesium_polylepis.1
MSAAFLDDTVTYVISREWKDLLWIYVLRLHPTPHCSEGVRYSFFGWARSVPTSPACTAEATAAQLTVAALGLLVIAIPLTQIAQRAGLAYAPRMLGMLVGWAVGDAVARWRYELLTDDAALHVAFAVGWSLLAALVQSVEPLLLAVECGEGDGIGACCERLCRTCWELVSRSLSLTVVMACAESAVRTEARSSFSSRTMQHHASGVRAAYAGGLLRATARSSPACLRSNYTARSTRGCCCSGRLSSPWASPPPRRGCMRCGRWHAPRMHAAEPHRALL